MKKILCTTLFLILAQNLWASTPSRGPSVEQMAEVDIETEKKNETASGYDFASTAPAPQKVVRERVPANIVTKTQTTSPYSYIGPFIFLITLPIAVWIMLSKKYKTKEMKDVGYYGKTHQFPHRRSEYSAAVDDDNDDIDYPKAS